MQSAAVDSDDEMEQQFQNAYDEVVALKRLLQDLLNVERSDVHDTDIGGSNAPLSLDGSLCSECDDDRDHNHDDGVDDHGDSDSYEPCEDELAGYPIRADALGSDDGTAQSPARVMCFSDEMRSFVPKALVDDSGRSSVIQRQRAAHLVATKTALASAPVVLLRAARRSNQPTLQIPRCTVGRDATSKHDGQLSDDGANDADDDVDDNRNRGSLSPHTRTPRASRRSLKMLRASATFEPNFQTRMRQFVAQNRQKKEQIRRAVCAQEDDCVQSTPTINRRSKRIHRDVSHLMAWNHEKTNKLSHLRQQELVREREQVVGTPAIARRSAALFAQRDDELAHCRVEDRLQLLGLIYAYQQQERLLAAQRHTSGDFHPRVAPHSANLTRPQTAPLAAHERLYRLAKRHTQRNDDNNGDGCDTPSNQMPERSDAVSTGRMRSSRNDANDSSQQPVLAAVQRLWAVGAAYEQKRQQQRELQHERGARLRDAPKMSRNSRKIVQQRTERAAAQPLVNATNPCTVQQQMHQIQQMQHARCPCCCPQRSEAPTATPSACRVDATRASAIFAKQLQWKRAKDARDAQRKRDDDERARSECTFRNPLYSDTWTERLLSPPLPSQLATTADAAASDVNTAFFERAQQWATDKEQRLAREKKLWDDIVMGECTFQPQLSPRKRSPSPRARSVWSPAKGVVLCTDTPRVPLVASPLLLSPRARPSSPYRCISSSDKANSSSCTPSSVSVRDDRM